MGTKLAEMAGTKELNGKVAVTSSLGVTTTYDDEAAAWDACKGMNLEHRRGAFFETTASAPKPSAPPAPPSEDSSSGSRRGRRRRSSSDD